MPEKSDHDLLIEINAKLSMFHDTFVKHCEDDSRVQGILQKDIKAAHRRMDMLTISGVLAVVSFIVTMWIKA